MPPSATWRSARAGGNTVLDPCGTHGYPNLDFESSKLEFLNAKSKRIPVFLRLAPQHHYGGTRAGRRRPGARLPGPAVACGGVAVKGRSQPARPLPDAGNDGRRRDRARGSLFSARWARSLRDGGGHENQVTGIAGGSALSDQAPAVRPPRDRSGVPAESRAVRSESGRPGVAPALLGAGVTLHGGRGPQRGGDHAKAAPDSQPVAAATSRLLR